MKKSFLLLFLLLGVNCASAVNIFFKDCKGINFKIYALSQTSTIGFDKQGIERQFDSNYEKIINCSVEENISDVYFNINDMAIVDTFKNTGFVPLSEKHFKSIAETRIHRIEISSAKNNFNSTSIDFIGGITSKNLQIVHIPAGGVNGAAISINGKIVKLEYKDILASAK